MLEKIFNVTFEKIESKSHAVDIIKATAYAQFFAGALTLILATINPYSLYDVVLFGVLGFLLLKMKSRIVAILIFLYSSANVLMTIGNSISDNPAGGTNVTLALMFLGLSIRAIQATFIYQRLMTSIPE